MNEIIGPLLLLLLPIGLAYWLVEWRLVTAFVSTAVLFPFLAITLVQLFLVLFQGERFDWFGLRILGTIFAMGSIYVYMILVLPAFLVLRRFRVAIHLSFPVMVTLIVFAVFFLIKNSRPVDAIAIAAITICSWLHSWMILGVCYLLKKIP